MVTHNNPNITRRYNEMFNLKGESAPTYLYDDIMPVVVVNPRVSVCRNASSGASGLLPIFTTPTDRDFYLTQAILSGMANAVSDSFTFYIAVVIDGVTRQIVNKAKLSLTATDFTIVANFDTPIKIDRGTTIQGFSFFTVGAQDMACSITGYTDPDN